MVLETNRLGDTDIYIRSLAYELDALLGTGFTFATFDGSVQTDANGFVSVPFPLTTIVGALIEPASTKASGQPMYADPVPPASIGLLIPNQAVQVFLSSMNPGYVRASLRVAAWQTVTGTAQTSTGYGSRPIQGNASFSVSGLAWGYA